MSVNLRFPPVPVFCRAAATVFVLVLSPLQAAEAQPSRSPGTPAGENAAEDGSVISYGADYFEKYNPVTALDMVERVPGFTLDEGDAVRGFGGAAGNVLIDGERPSAKQQSLSDLLGQIPAESVSRIDLIRGRAPGIDMRGQTVVINIIRHEERSGGFVEATLRLSEALRLSPSGEASYSGEIGGYAYTVGARHFTLEDLDNQPEVLLNAAGRTVEFRDEDADIIPQETTVTANVEKTFGAWNTRLNNEFLYSDFNFREVSPAFIPGTATLIRRNLTNVNDKLLQGEMGADAKRSWSDTLSLKIIGVQTLRHLDSRQAFRESFPDREGTIVRQTIDDLSGESILRGVLTMTPDRGTTYEAGLEATYNFLDSNVDLTRDTGSGPVPVELPISKSRVEEYRGEAFGNASWVPDDEWTLELGLTAEFSRLAQSGDAEEARTFLFLKPAFSAVHELSERHQLRVEFLREVAQLDFKDFVSSVTLNEQTTDLGNPDLEPQRAWVIRAAWEGRFTKNDSLSLLVEHKWAQAVQELVPIQNQFDAPGNIGDGTFFRTRLEWQISLDRFGLSDALIDGWYEFAASSVRDPVTGEERRAAFRAPGQPFQSHRFDINFRQDFPETKWAWGASYAYRSNIEEFRIDETRLIRLGDFDIDVFVETTRFWDMKFRLTLERGEPRVFRRRVLFDGPRSLDNIRAIEVRDRTPETRVVLTARRAF